MSGAEPRTGLRDVAPYVSPQLDVAARLNTNECPYPLPPAFADDLAEAVKAIPFNRYPDRDATAQLLGATDAWHVTLGRNTESLMRLEELALRKAAKQGSANGRPRKRAQAPSSA